MPICGERAGKGAGGFDASGIRGVDSLEEFAKHLATLGYKYSDGPHLRPDGGGIAFVDAPEGYEIELIQKPKTMGL